MGAPIPHEFVNGAREFHVLRAVRLRELLRDPVLSRHSGSQQLPHGCRLPVAFHALERPGVRVEHLLDASPYRFSKRTLPLLGEHQKVGALDVVESELQNVTQPRRVIDLRSSASALGWLVWRHGARSFSWCHAYWHSSQRAATGLRREGASCRPCSRHTCTVAVTDHTRKVLWALGGNSCAKCRAPLVQEASTADEPHAIVGRECHIVARSPEGPRANDGARRDLDDYANLILLCATCHAVIDAQPQQYPVSDLQQIKREHEARVKQRGAPAQSLDWHLEGRGEPLQLQLTESGDALLAVVGPCYSFSHQFPDKLSSEQREAVASLLQDCVDWGSMFSDLGPRGQMDAGASLQDHIDSLRADRLVVFSGTAMLTLRASAEKSPWPEAIVVVVHEADARHSTTAESGVPTGAQTQ